MPMKNPVPTMYFLRYSSNSFRISPALDRVIFVKLFSLPAGMKSLPNFALSWIILFLSSD